MSDEAKTPGDPGVEAPNASDSAGSLEPNIVTVHGKEFDVNDPIQKAQLSGWDEAYAKLVGRQTNELGKLRQFYKERQPSKDEVDLLKAAKQKAAEGNVEDAIDMVFAQSKAAIAQADALRQADSKNSELWEEYFAERSELAKKLGRQRIKQVSATLDIFNEGVDAFQVLDSYWLPLIQSEKPVSGKAPATLSGVAHKAPSPAGTVKDEKPKASLDDILNQASAYFRK